LVEINRYAGINLRLYLCHSLSNRFVFAVETLFNPFHLYPSFFDGFLFFSLNRLLKQPLVLNVKMILIGLGVYVGNLFFDLFLPFEPFFFKPVHNDPSFFVCSQISYLLGLERCQ